MGRTISVQLNDKEELALTTFVEEQKKIFLEKQRLSMSPEDFESLTNGGKFPYMGAIGGELTYLITYTSIGTQIEVKYLDEQLDITDYSSW
jgi:hypothetical protein